ncbi:hypothetical protein G6F40_014645 [Rhizopus arrhizus]|nr:hypothetical protein G6F40_014645 [Rhizopus arrhizus]
MFSLSRLVAIGSLLVAAGGSTTATLPLPRLAPKLFAAPLCTTVQPPPLALSSNTKLSLLAGADQLRLYCGTLTRPGALITDSIAGGPITAPAAARPGERGSMRVGTTGTLHRRAAAPRRPAHYRRSAGEGRRRLASDRRRARA